MNKKSLLGISLSVAYFIFLACSPSIAAQVLLSSKITGPGNYTLNPSDEYYGQLDLFLSAGQQVNINGQGATIRDTSVSRDVQIILNNGKLEIQNCKFISSNKKNCIQASNNAEVTIENNTTFSGHNTTLLFVVGSKFNITNSTFTGVNSGILISGGIDSTLANSTISGTQKGTGKGLQASSCTKTIAVSNCTFEKFDIGFYANGGSPISADGCSFKSMNVGILLDGSSGTIKNCQFGSLSETLSSQETKGVMVNGGTDQTISNSTFTNLTFGIQVLNQTYIEIQNTTYNGCKNGVMASGKSFISLSGGSTFENLQTNDTQPPRGILVAEGSTCAIASPAHFSNFFTGEGINISGDDTNGRSELTVTSTNKSDFTFTRVGKCFVIDNGHSAVDKVSMQNCGKGFDLIGAGTPDHLSTWTNSEFIVTTLTPEERKTADAIAAVDSFMNIENNYINGASGGVICVRNDYAIVKNNIILNMRTNAVNLTQSSNSVVHGNFCQKTEVFDVVYVEDSENISIYNNILLDGSDNGIFCVDSEVTAYHNVIIGAWNLGIGAMVKEGEISPPGANVTAYDNTILNCGNSSLKCDTWSRLTAYANICGVVNAKAYPSQRSLSDFDQTKLISNFDSQSRGVVCHENLFFGALTLSSGIDSLNSSPITDSILEIYNNTIVDAQKQGLRLENNGSNLSIIQNYLDRNDLSKSFTEVEFTNSSPTFQYNIFGSAPATRFLYANPTGVNVKYNYWGADSGPAQPAHTVYGGDYTPFLTAREIYHDYSAALAPSGNIIQWNSAAAVGVNLTVTLKTGADIQGATHILSATRFTKTPYKTPPLNSAVAYYNVLIDQRILNGASSIQLTIQTPGVYTSLPSLWVLNYDAGTWHLNANGTITQSVTSTFTPENWKYHLFAITEESTKTPTPTPIPTPTPLPTPTPTLPSTWYVAEGATYEMFDTFLLIANMNNFQINVKIDFLTEKGNNQTIYMPVGANSRTTIKVDDYVINDGVSTVLSETSGKGFAVERAMYLAGPNGRWYGGHAAVGVTQPKPDWFLAEGATVTAGPAGSPFETYILVANPNASAVPIEVTFFPEGELPIIYNFNVDANRRLTISPQTLDTRLVNKSFSTKVHSTTGAGILVERAMWWRASNWTAPNFMEGTDSPGLPALSSSWYLAEGNTEGFDDFILIVNPNSAAANIVINYYLEGNSTPVVRNLTVGGNARKTINVRWDPEGIGFATKHGTSITSTQPIAVERSMYWTAGGFGWKGGHNSIASPVTSTFWIMPEGATVPIAYGKLRTEILLANPNSTDAFATVRFLLTTGEVVVKNYTIPYYQRKTIVCNDITELYDKAFSTVVVSNKQIVVERSMYWDTDTPTLITRAGGTCSMGIPQGVGGGGALPPEQPRKSITRVDDWEIY